MRAKQSSLTFKLFSGNFFLGFLSASFSLFSNKTKIIYFPSGLEMVKPPEQPAGFEKAEQASFYICLTLGDISQGKRKRKDGKWEVLKGDLYKQWFCSLMKNETQWMMEPATKQ